MEADVSVVAQRLACRRDGRLRRLRRIASPTAPWNDEATVSTARAVLTLASQPKRLRIEHRSVDTTAADVTSRWSHAQHAEDKDRERAGANAQRWGHGSTS